MANSEEDIKIVITADDKASGALANVSKNAGGLGKDMEGTLTKSLGVATAGFAAMAGAAYYSIKQFEDSDKAVKQMEAVLKSTGGAAGLFKEDLLDQASALQKMTTYSDEAVISAENLLLTFTNVKGGVFQEAIPVILDMSTALGQDLKSSSIQLGKALNDPIQGINALRRVGVSFSEDQRKVIETLVTTGHTVEAQKLILEELNKEFGGSSAAAAETFSGKMAILNNQLSDLAEGVGKSLVDMLSKFVEKITPIIEKVAEFVGQHPQLVAAIIAITGVAFGLVAAISALGLVVIAFSAVSLPIVGIILAIVAALAVLGFAVYEVIKHWDDITNFFQQTWDGIKIIFFEAVESVKNFFIEGWEGIKIFLQDTWNGLSDSAQGWILLLVSILTLGLYNLVVLIHNHWDQIKAFFKEGWAGVVIIFHENIDPLVAWLSGVWDTISGAIESAWGGIKNFFSNIWNEIIGVFDRAIKSIADKLKPILSMIDKIQSAGKAIGGAGGGVISGIGNQLKGLIPTFNDVIITPGGAISTHPDDFIFAMKDPSQLGKGGNGTTVNVHVSGTFLSEDAAVQIGDMITQRLKLELKL